MKERLFSVLKPIWVLISFCLLICVAPLWGIYWIITGWSWADWAEDFMEPTRLGERLRTLDQMEEHLDLLIKKLEELNIPNK